MTAEKERSRLYLITPPSFEIPSFVEEFKKACDGGDISTLQLRLKDCSVDNIKRASEALIPLCHEREIAFIINDSPKLAKEAGADGVHIGEEDGTTEEARKIIGDDLVIGVSCYDSRERAFTAGDEGADYIAFGAFYHTTTKKVIRHPDIEILDFWSKYTILPSVAIGGIKPNNLAPLVKAGANFIAVVTGIWNHPKGAMEAVREYNAAIDEAIAT